MMNKNELFIKPTRYEHMQPPPQLPRHPVILSAYQLQCVCLDELIQSSYVKNNSRMSCEQDHSVM